MALTSTTALPNASGDWSFLLVQHRPIQLRSYEQHRNIHRESSTHPPPASLMCHKFYLSMSRTSSTKVNREKTWSHRVS